jgi:hypothetical protein
MEIGVVVPLVEDGFPFVALPLGPAILDFAAGMVKTSRIYVKGIVVVLVQWTSN